MRNRLGLDVEFENTDYMRHHLGHYSVVFINPDNNFSRGLNRKLLRELSGLLIVYNHVHRPSGLVEGTTYWYDQIPVTLYTKSDTIPR